ncbi:MAG TPA: 2OG-Fe(II) oxygenase, partial [Candidatus Baltobacteraceae bacterium]
MSGVVAPEVLGAAPALRQQFDEAAPFRHVLIENFFVAGFARALLEQFPPPAGATRNPFGAAGAKAFCSDLALLGPAYREVHQYLGSAPFLNWVGAITGIEALVYDQTNFGGGTHENFDGRDLRPHVDFNYHPVTKLHRRVNMIVYLNEVWEPQWGGAITLARDPRDPFSEAVAYEPTFNRCIIFETSEHSWHGFERVALPVGQQHRTRKSLSIYLYSREREAGQIHREHTTFFVPRPLPSRFAGGYTLSEDDASELGELMGHRDRLIALYHREQGKQEDG